MLDLHLAKELSVYRDADATHVRLKGIHGVPMTGSEVYLVHTKAATVILRCDSSSKVCIGESQRRELALLETPPMGSLSDGSAATGRLYLITDWSVGEHCPSTTVDLEDFSEALTTGHLTIEPMMIGATVSFRYESDGTLRYRTHPE